MITYTDGSTKHVTGWMQVGDGVCFGLHHQHHFSAHVLADERQSIGWEEPQRVLHAMLSRVLGARMVVMLDLEYVFTGITIWSDKWRPHGGKTSPREVGHRDLWEHILWLR